ncbi:MAG: hypothetical protein KAJ18_09465 [Candidatus Omnitrophica bacterium]|nr:hypothetical protein [Candidatus Omnitrophota bacterium]
MRRITVVLSLIFFLNLIFCLNCSAQQSGNVVVDFNGVPQVVTYQAYVPLHNEADVLPVMVCVGGLPSGPDECSDKPWIQFADKNKIVVLGLGFTFVKEDWPRKSSYQFAQAWSGQALLDVLDILEKIAPIDKNDLYLFGVSAGAQFSHRFALMRPDMVKAVAAHAAGGYGHPEEFISTKFLITVGENDTKAGSGISRLQFARIFAAACEEQGVGVDLRVIPGIAHRWIQEQNIMSRQFFLKVRRE